MLELVARAAVGSVFLYAAVPKIMDPAAFAKVVYSYQILPVTASNVLAVTLPWIELAAGLVLAGSALVSLGRYVRRRTAGTAWGGPWVPVSALVVSGLLVLFIAAIAIAMARGVDISCGCFGTSPEGRKLGWSTLGEDVVLLAASLLVLRRRIIDRARRSA